MRLAGVKGSGVPELSTVGLVLTSMFPDVLVRE